MHSCLSSTHLSVLVNGSPKELFRMEKGVWQGDPLSPYLYVMVAKALLMFQVVSSQGWIQGLRIENSDIEISHLQYAYATGLFLKADIEVLKTVRVVLQ